VIKHIALFNLKDEHEGRSKNENLQAILNNVGRLKNDVPINKRIEASQQLERDRTIPWAADLAVYVEFDSVEDYDSYVAHPIHQECAAFAASVSDHVEGITYESTLLA
jgi:hypothetical protein